MIVAMIYLLQNFIRQVFSIVTQHELMRLFEGDIKTDILNIPIKSYR